MNNDITSNSMRVIIVVFERTWWRLFQNRVLPLN